MLKKLIGRVMLTLVQWTATQVLYANNMCPLEWSMFTASQSRKKGHPSILLL